MRNRRSAARAACGSAHFGILLGALLLLFSASPARAQLGDSIPSTAYYNSFPLFYEGEYAAALGAFQNDLQSGIRSPTSRWIDSVCYYTMCGECYYHMGQHQNALNQYTAALKLYSAFYNWMIQVQFPAAISPAGVGAPNVAQSSRRLRSTWSRGMMAHRSRTPMPITRVMVTDRPPGAATCASVR